MGETEEIVMPTMTSEDASPKLGLHYILGSQAQKHVTHNHAIR